MSFFYFLIYLIACLLVGFAGIRLPLGFIGFFLLSFFLTPVIGLILLIISSPLVRQSR